MTNKSIRVLLVDDHQVLRDGLRLLMESEPDMVVIGEAADGQQALESAKNLRPDVVVMDLSLPDISGIEVTRQVTKNYPDMKVLVLSMHSKKEFVINAIEAGAAGYVPKSSTHESLLDAIRTIQSGQRYLHPMAANALVEGYIEDGSSAEQRYQELTEREQEVFQLSAKGYTSKEIGERLFISPKTVDTYRQRGYEKLGIEHRSEVIRLALNLGILDDLKEN
jgi:two-component system response regulator NreC